jgi:DNA polymerase I
MALEPGIKLDLITRSDQIPEFLDWLALPRPALGVDTETTGLNPYTGDRIRLIQFGDMHRGWSLPWVDWRGFAIEVLQRWQGRYVLHNSLFDVGFIENETDFRFDWSRIDDTRSMAHILNATRSTGLKQLATSLVDPRAASGQHLLKKMMAEKNWEWGTIPLDAPEYWAYAAMDPVLTCYLREVLLEEIQRSSAQAAYDVEVGCLPIVGQIQKRGIRVDLAYCNEAFLALDAYTFKLNDWAREAYDCKLSSNDDLAMHLELAGETLLERTATGKISVKKSVLEDLTHPLAVGALALRQTVKMKNAYFKNLMEYERDEIVHPSINPMGARTGRWSIGRPALQQMPKWSRMIRDAFVPREGHMLWSIDANAVEMRLLAHFAQEASMIEAVERGQDLHTFTAQLAYGVTEPTPLQRTIAKRTGFARIYGAGNAKIAASAGISLEETEIFVRRYNEIFPGVERFITQTIDEGRICKQLEGVAYVRTPLGRFERADDGKEYALVNYRIQGTAAEIMKRQLIELSSDKEISDCILLSVHDEVLFEFPHGEEGAQMAQRAAALMTDTQSFSVPITMEVSGPMNRWGDVVKQGEFRDWLVHSYAGREDEDE